MLDTRNIVDELKGMDDDRIKMIYNNNALPFGVCVVNLTGGLNMGCIVRAANAFGANEVFYLGRKHYDKRSAVGVWNYTTVKYIDLSELGHLKNRYRFIGVDNNVPNCKLINTYEYPTNSLFFFGEESTGLDKNILDMCDDIIFIKQIGTVRSLNVSTAAGIVLFDYASKMQQGG